MLVNLVSKFGLVNPKKKVNFGESKFTSFGASGRPGGVGQGPSDSSSK